MSSSKRTLKSLVARTLFFILRTLQLLLTVVLIALTAHLIKLYHTTPANTSIDLSLLLFNSNESTSPPSEFIASIFVPSIVTVYLLLTFLVVCFAHRSMFIVMGIIDFLCMSGMIGTVICLRFSTSFLFREAPGARICMIEELTKQGDVFERSEGSLSSWNDCQVVKAGFSIAIVEVALFMLSMFLSLGLWRMHVQPEEVMFVKRHEKPETIRSSFDSHQTPKISCERGATLPGTSLP